MDLVVQVLLALVPSLGVGFLFYTIIKALVEGDRRERLAYSQWQDERERQSREASSASSEEDSSRPSA